MTFANAGKVAWARRIEATNSDVKRWFRIISLTFWHFSRKDSRIARFPALFFKDSNNPTRPGAIRGGAESVTFKSKLALGGKFVWKPRAEE